MAQALFDAIAGVATELDSQTAVAIQSLLESQTSVVSDSSSAVTQIGSCFGTVSTTLIDEEDVFLCGKCKKQYTSLSAFMSHKRELCGPCITTALISSPSDESPSSLHDASESLESLPTVSIGETLTSMSPQQIQVSAGYATNPTPPLSQSVVLNEADLLSLTNSIENGTLTLPTPMSSLFLSQIGPLSPTALTSSLQTSRSILVKAEENPIVTCSVVPLTRSDRKPVLMPKIAIFEENTDKDISLSILNDFHTTLPKPLDTAADSQKCSESEKQKFGKLQCSYCERVFSKNFDLQQHIRSHTGEKPFQCIVCGRAFAQKSNVKKHMQTHKVWPEELTHTLPKQPPPQKVIASAVEELSVQENALESAGLQVNTSVDEAGKMHIVIDNSYTCQLCSINFKTYFELKAHFKHHKSERVYKCILKTCGQTFQELDTFLEHTKMHEHEMTYRCHLCSKTFSSLYELGVHQYTHALYPNQSSKPPTKSYRCTICMSKYATPEALDHHMASTDHNFPCPHCEKVYSSERYLRRHLSTHGTLALHTCGVCAKAFKTDYLLRMHMLIHSGDKPFSCSFCKAAFNRKDKLKRHLLIHEPVKRFKCPFRSYIGCLKEFNRPDKLKAHIITHSGLKPFKCLHCCRSFSRKPHLREHEKLHCEDFLKKKQQVEHVCGEKGKTKRTLRNGKQKKKCASSGFAEYKQSASAPKRRGRPRKELQVELSSSENDTLQQPNGDVDDAKYEPEISINDNSEIEGLACSEQPSSMDLELNSMTSSSVLRTLLLQLEPKCDQPSD